jgi:hypothetical protein
MFGISLLAKRSSFIAFFVFLFILFGFSINLSGQEINPITIEIEKENEAFRGRLISIPITITEGSAEIEKYNLKVRYNSRALTFYGITKSELYDIPGNYEWEYLTYRIGDSTHASPLEIYRTIQITGIANIENDEHQPVDLSLNQGTILVYLNFHITYHKHFDCWFLPIEFFWEDCNDNVVHFIGSADTVAGISENVFDPQGMEITDYFAGMPGTFGAPDECLELLSASRLVDFYSGGIDLVCYGDVTSRGDLNLNGQPYEISDAVVYDNYLKWGLISFTINPPRQIEESDINCDGTTLSVTDYMMLVRIIRDLTPPCF